MREDNLPQSKKGHLDKIFSQRHFQRSFIFWFAIITTGVFSLSLVIIICLLVVFGHKFSVLQGYEVEIFSIGVFTQFIGVIMVITKSLWDDSTYKDLLKNR